MNRKSQPFTTTNIANIIAICGPTRSGKVIVSKIVSSFKDFEKINVDFLWEQFIQLFFLKKLNKINAIYLLRRGISLLTYNLFIGREINFRKKDFSSIYSYQDPRIYLRRAKFAKEGDNVFKNLKRKKMNIPIMIHWGVNASNLLFETFSNIKIVRMVKNPFEIAYSWLKRDYGGKFYSNPRTSSLTLKFNNKILPYFAYGWEKIYLKSNKYDRVGIMISKYISKEMSVYNSLNKINKKKILNVEFNQLIKNPKKTVIKIEKFLKSKQTKFTKKVLRQEKLPRNLNLQNLESKKNFFKKKMSSKVYQNLLKVEKKYIKFSKNNFLKN